MELAAIFAPLFLAIGLSVIFYVEQWQKLLGAWQKDHFTLFPLFFFYIIIGMVVVRMHNIWSFEGGFVEQVSGYAITIIGWGMVLKGIIYMVLPGSFLKSILEMKNNKGLLYFGGIVSAVVGAVMGYGVWFM